MITRPSQRETREHFHRLSCRIVRSQSRRQARSLKVPRRRKWNRCLFLNRPTVRSKTRSRQASLVGQVGCVAASPSKPGRNRLRNCLARDDDGIAVNGSLRWHELLVGAGDGEMCQRHAIAANKSAITLFKMQTNGSRFNRVTGKLRPGRNQIGLAVFVAAPVVHPPAFSAWGEC